MSDTYTVGVTGAGGYIGSRLTKLLLEAGHEVIPVDNFYNAQVDAVGGEDIIEADVRERERMEDLFSEVDVVVHLAAITGIPECEENSGLAFDVNVNGTGNVAWVCRENGIPLIFPMSMQVFGPSPETPVTADTARDPQNMYGLTKVLGEDIVSRLSDGSFPALVFIKSNVYGTHEIDDTEVEKGTVVTFFLDRARDGEPLTVHRPGTQERDFIHVKDVARAYTAAIERVVERTDTGTEAMTLASGESRSIMEVAETVQAASEEAQGDAPDIELVENPRTGDVVERIEVDTSRVESVLDLAPEHDLYGTAKEALT